MRKLVYIITLSFTLLLISTTIHAQGLTVSGDRPEDIAKAKVSMLQDELKLSGNQQRAYVKREVGIKKHVADKGGSRPAVLELKSKLEQDLEKAVKKELTAEQFATWKKEFAGK